MTSNRPRILVVDDNKMARMEIARTVERGGYDVSEVEGGERALEILRSESFDLVLLDLLMPDTDGFEVLEQMMADAELCAIPVIVVTAVEERDSVRKSISLGAADHITKPINHKLLGHRIRTVLASRAGTRPR